MREPTISRSILLIDKILARAMVMKVSFPMPIQGREEFFTRDRMILSPTRLAGIPFEVGFDLPLTVTLAD